MSLERLGIKNLCIFKLFQTDLCTIGKTRDIRSLHFCMILALSVGLWEDSGYRICAFLCDSIPACVPPEDPRVQNIFIFVDYNPAHIRVS